MALEVLHVLGSAAADGAGIARLVRLLAAGLDARTYRLHACFLGSDGPLVGELARSGIAARAFGWEAGAHDLAGACRFWRYVRAERFSIVHQHAGSRSVRWVARAASNAAVVVHLHGSVLEADGARLRRVGPHEAAAIIATSRAVAMRAGPVGTRVIYPGVPLDPRRATGPPDSKPASVIGAAGRLVRVKAHADFLRAAALLLPEWPALRIEILGDGPERPALEDEARRLGLEGQVTFLGWRADVSAVLARWAILAHPSLEEGFGLTALEAMAAGLPVVATRVGGLPEIVDDRVTGLLVRAGDPSDLARALKGLLGNPALARAMGSKGRERAAAHFSVDRMVAATRDIYANLAVRIPAA